MERKRKTCPSIDESKYAGRWVALDPKTLAVVADAATLKAARAEAAKRGVPDPLLHVVPESDAYFIGMA